MMRRLLAISGAVFADAIRRRVVLAVLFFAVILVFASPALPSYGMGVVEGVYREVALALTFAASLVLTLSLAANRVPGEIERRTVYNVVAKPVARWEYVAGTWLGVVAVMGCVIAGFTVTNMLVGYVQYHEVMWRLWQGALAIWFEMGVIGAFAIAVSTVSGPVVVVVASLAFEFIGHSRDSVPGAADGILRFVYPSLDPFNIINPVAHGTGVPAGYLATMALAFAGWAVALLLLGAIGFGRRDL